MDPRIRASRKQERRVAEDMGGRTTPGSGSKWFVKNDVLAPGWSVECKTTTGTSYSLKLKDLKTAEKNALLDNRQMAFVIAMDGHHYAVLPYSTFLALLPQEDT